MEAVSTVENTRNFKGVWIPAEIWLNSELDFMEKALYAEIDSLDGEDGCFASNDYFSKFFGASERTIQRGLSKLKTLGFVSQELFNGRQRRLRATRQKCHLWGDKNVTSGVTNLSPIYNNIENSLDNSPLTPQGEPGSAIDEAPKTNKSVLSAKPSYRKPSPPNGPRTPSPKSDEGFGEFWTAYPKSERKVGKAKCLEIWRRESLADCKDKVLKALNQDKTSQNWNKENGRWIPMPATWLNRKRHLDVEDEAPKTETVEMWSVLTITDSADVALEIEWRNWLDRYSRDRSVKAPAWSLKTGEWVLANSHLIESALKLNA